MQLNQRPLGLETLNGTGVTFAGSVSVSAGSGLTVKGTRLAVAASTLVSGSGMTAPGALVVSGSSALSTSSDLLAKGVRLLIGSASALATSGMTAVPGRFFAADHTAMTCSSALSCQAIVTYNDLPVIHMVTIPVSGQIIIGESPLTRGLIQFLANNSSSLIHFDA